MQRLSRCDPYYFTITTNKEYNMKYFIKAVKKYKNFNGRSSRIEYWMFVLFYFIFYCVFCIPIIIGAFCNNEIIVNIGNALICIFSLVMIVPSFAIAFRRMHDIGKSGGWFFINLIPIIGNIWYFVLCCTGGQPNSNKYGEVPNNL